MLAKALSQFNLLRRTCHFVKNHSKKRTLYLTIVRSIFEHCSSIWCPTMAVTTNKFEPLQKICVKWILNEQFCSYSELDYLKRLFDLKIMPFSYKFAFNDMKLFYKICNDLVPISLPDYVITRTNTRTSSADATPVYCIDPNLISSYKHVFTHSFFPRCISLWNTLPTDVRISASFHEFCNKLEAYYWKDVTSHLNDIDPEPD